MGRNTKSSTDLTNSAVASVCCEAIARTLPVTAGPITVCTASRAHTYFASMQSEFFGHGGSERKALLTPCPRTTESAEIAADEIMSAPKNAAGLNMTSNGEVEEAHTGVWLEPWVHTVFPHPRRHYRVSRHPPTIVRSLLSQRSRHTGPLEPKR